MDGLDGNLLVPLLGNYMALIFDEDEGVLHGDAVWEKINGDVDRFLHYEDAAFKLHFRMPTETFDSSTNVYAEFTEEATRVRRNEEFNLRHVLLAVLWILATPDCFRSVALLFNFTPGVLHYHYQTVIAALCELCAHFVTWPSQEERALFQRSVERKTGFPGTVGAIDGMHVSLCSAPRDDGQRYVNRHHESSIILQAVVDPTLSFRDVYVGEPGSLHDSRVFRRSDLCKRLLEDPDVLSQGEHIIGDGAYILTDRVMTPFRNNGHLTRRQSNYNHRHASARSMVERAFGLLQCKWRRLIYLSSVNLEFACQNVMASIMLHNFILNEDEELPWVPNDAGWAQNRIIVDDDADVDVDHVNMEIERDHPLLGGARRRGIERRYEIVDNLPFEEL